jgi:hypothetical protein
MKYAHVYAMFPVFVFHNSCVQNQTNLPKDHIKAETKDSVSSYGPNSMVRHVKQAITKRGDMKMILLRIAGCGRIRSFVEIQDLPG